MRKDWEGAGSDFPDQVHMNQTLTYCAHGVPDAHFALKVHLKITLAVSWRTTQLSAMTWTAFLPTEPLPECKPPQKTTMNAVCRAHCSHSWTPKVYTLVAATQRSKMIDKEVGSRRRMRRS